ncbi:MAG TPA: HEAT repeat domain-containing protein [Acidobacteriaceae bacterium]|nr:HEAT repeat domain-containing protein [Acidobacteriaceae bacterium]
MKCDLAQQHIIHYVYGELGDEACHELELHVLSCESCRNELQVYQALRHAMSLVPVEEPSANLLAQSRIRLEDALDQLPPPTVGMRVQTSIYGFIAQLRAAPAVAAGLAAVGFLVGGLAGHAWKQQVPLRPTVLTSAAHTTITPAPQVFNVSGIVQHPDTNMVEVHYNQIVPETVEGSMDDPEVQKLLLMATHNEMDPTVQDDSVNLLAAQCQAGHFCDGEPVRTALMVALRYDRDASVRAKALDGLEPYVAEDTHVRDAILESLLHDPSMQVRSAAIHMLQPVQADSSVRVVLQTLAHQDQNASIRLASEQALQAMPVTQ